MSLCDYLPFFADILLIREVVLGILVVYGTEKQPLDFWGQSVHFQGQKGQKPVFSIFARA